MRSTLVLAAVLLAGFAFVPTAGAIGRTCNTTPDVQVCYDPYTLSCFIGATYDVGPVSGSDCVNWCRIVPCPGPVASLQAFAVSGCVTPVSGGDIEETYCVHPGDTGCLVEHREVTFTGTTDTCTGLPLP